MSVMLNNVISEVKSSEEYKYEEGQTNILKAKLEAIS